MVDDLEAWDSDFSNAIKQVKWQEDKALKCSRTVTNGLYIEEEKLFYEEVLDKGERVESCSIWSAHKLIEEMAALRNLLVYLVDEFHVYARMTNKIRKLTVKVKEIKWCIKLIPKNWFSHQRCSI